MRLLNKLYLPLTLLCLLKGMGKAQHQAKPDSVKTVHLEELEVVSEKENGFGISKLNNVEGTVIYAGKKSEAVYLNSLNANLATNNSRQIFSKIPGINIFESDGSGNSIGIGGRGLNPNRISNFNTRQNGYDISADALGYPESYYVPPAEALERIEVLRGAASLQFGTQFGGMINYRFKAPPAKKFGLTTRQTTGSFGLFNAFTQFGGTGKKVSYAAFYNYKHYRGWRPNSALNSHTGFAAVSYKLNENIHLKAEYTHMQYLSQQPGGLTDKQFNENPWQSNRNRNWFRVNWNLYNLNADFKLGDRTRMNLLVFGVLAGRDALGTLDRIDRKDDTTKNRNLLRDNYKNHAAELRFIQRYTLLNQQSNFLAGIRLYRGNTQRQQGDASKNTLPEFEFLNPNSLENSAYTFPSTNVAAFTENVFQLNRRWSITPGLRWEYIATGSNGYYRLLNKDLAGNIVLDQTIADKRENKRHFLLAGLGSQFKIKNWLESYLNFSQNYRSINFNDMRVVNPNFQVDPNLKDETGFTSDAGIRGALKQLLYFDVSVFMINYNNRIGTIIKPDSTTFQLIRYRTNVSNSRNTGIEAFAELDWLKLRRKQTTHKLSTFINFSYIHAIYLGGLQAGFKGKKVEYVPNIILRTGLTYVYKKFSVTLQHAYTASQFSDATNANSTPSAIYGLIPAYHVVDLSARYGYKRWQISSGINNLLNARYFTRRAEGYPGPGIIPADPINLYLTLQYQL